MAKGRAGTSLPSPSGRSASAAAEAQPRLAGGVQEANGFLLGNADLDLAAPYVPPPASRGQGRKGSQLKDKTVSNQAGQEPRCPASLGWRNPASSWATEETWAPSLGPWK